MDEVVIKVEKVYKDFLLPHEKISSIKGMVTGLSRGKPWKIKETQHALKDISFEIKKGEFFGIVGRNGSGKSTLLKILANIYQPTSGKVYTKGKLVPFIELGVGFNPELSGRDNVYLNGAMLGFSEKEVDRMYDDIVAFAEIERFMDQKLKNYSSGMQVRLAFSMATRSEADILLIDEVLAVGDADFQRKCYKYFKKLKKNKKTVVFVSHDMSAVREFCDRALLVDNSKIVSIGNTSHIADKYNQLFNENSVQENILSPIDQNRWGNGDIFTNNVHISTNTDHVIIKINLSARKNIDKLIYGLHILGADGAELTAANNRMLQIPDLINIKKGAEVSLSWKILNIFNDGTYSVTLTFIDDLANTLDWWIDAASFVVKRDERSTTAILPPIEITNKIEYLKENTK
jgi:ABC-2 type transport system ATP-binding protein